VTTWGRLMGRDRGGGLCCPSAVCARAGIPAGGLAPQVCPVCGQTLPLADGAAFPSRKVAVVGSERCGQTSWIVRAFDDLTRESERFRFPIEGQEQRWEDQLRALSLGNPLAATPSHPGVALCLDFTQRGICRRLYVYDSAAQESGEACRLARHRNFKYLNGLVVVLDPFGLAPVRHRYGQMIVGLRPPVSPSPDAFAEGRLAVVLRALEVHRPTPPGLCWELDVAVVITKLDVLGLGRRLGSEQSSPDEIHAACQTQVAEWGFDNMSRALAAHFRRVRFFATWPGAHGAFAASNALQWMFEEAA